MRKHGNFAVGVLLGSWADVASTDFARLISRRRTAKAIPFQREYHMLQRSKPLKRTLDFLPYLHQISSRKHKKMKPRQRKKPFLTR